jgi:hypothetical protein
MRSSGVTYWSPGPIGLAVEAKKGQKFSEADWKDALRERLDSLGEQTQEPLRLMQRMFLEAGEDLGGLNSPGDLVDHPVFYNVLERQDCDLVFPATVGNVLGEDSVAQDLEGAIQDMLIPIRD